MKIKKIKLLFILVFTMFVILPIKVNAMSLTAYDYNGNSKLIEVETSDTIEAVKEKIGMEADKTVNDTIIVLDGKELQNGRTLADYLIKDTDIIYMLDDNYYTLNVNGGQFEGLSSEQKEYIVPGYTPSYFLSTIYRVKDGYIFKGWYTESVGGYLFEYYRDDLGLSEITKFYAHWDKEDTVTINLEAIGGDVRNMTNYDLDIFNRVIEGVLVTDLETGIVKSKSGKHLFTVKIDGSGLYTLADDLNKNNNILYTLSETDKEKIKYNGHAFVPDKVELIVSTKEVYKVVFDANGGVFKDHVKTIEVEDIINFDYETLKKPTRDGYNFIGFYTKDDKSYYDVMNSEAGIEEDTIFYAKWQEVSKGGGQAGIPEGGEQEDNTGNTSTGNTSNTTTNKPTGNNPQTSDNIMLFVIILGVSMIGITATTRIRKKLKNN